MKARRWAAVAALAALAAGANVVEYCTYVPADVEVALVSSDDSAVPPAGPGHTLLPWADLAGTRRDPRGLPTFPPSLRALQGQRVEVSGFAFQLRSGLDGGNVLRFALMPPSLSGCCGPVCTPSPERTVLVQCATPAPAAAWGAQPGVYARVQGVLALADTDSLGCYYTLREASCRLYRMVDDRRAELVFDARPASPLR